MTGFCCDYSLTINDYFLVTCLLKQQYNWRENNLLIINSSFVSLVLLYCGCDSLFTKLIFHECESVSNIIQASVLHSPCSQFLPEAMVSCLNFYLLCPDDFGTKVNTQISTLFFGIGHGIVLHNWCCYFNFF